jgi:malate dehydrogenase (quinone)
MQKRGTYTMDKALVEERASTAADDVVNQRKSFMGQSSLAKPAKEVGCFESLFGPKTYPPCAEADVVLVGGGIMSTTLGVILQHLEPSWKIVLYEGLHAAGEEATNGWNNAGTGHTAFCELNYMPEDAQGNMSDKKAVSIAEAFQLSIQFWSSLVSCGDIPQPKNFINTTPHMSFVWGEKNVAFLKKRFEILSKQPLFKGMEFTEDPKKITEWAPLLMKEREDMTGPFAATRHPHATDVNFGEVCKSLVKIMAKKGAEINMFHSVKNLRKQGDMWRLTVGKDDMKAQESEIKAKFVFLGAGGGTLPLLQKSGIPEAKGFGAFPISGGFLVCQKNEVASQHNAKVYGLAAVGAPPMSVPHLDSRIIGGKEMVLFGPYAGFSPRFLKTGSLLDWFCSFRPHNLIPMAAAGLQNLDLTVYLGQQLLASKAAQFATLKEYCPSAKEEDWSMTTAGQRVQIMKKAPWKWEGCLPSGGGILQFGTEVVFSADGTIAGLLGASPGASVAVNVALDVLGKCFPTKIKGWEPKIQELIPTHGSLLSEDPPTAEKEFKRCMKILQVVN